MKIALLVPAMDTGGVEQGTYDLAAGFVRRGHQALVISGPGRFLPRLEAAGVRHYLVPMERKNTVEFTAALRRVSKILRSERPDIIHARSRLPAWIAYLAGGRRPPAGHFVTSIHGFHHTRWYSRIMGRGERVIVVSQGLKKYTAEFLGADPQLIRVVYNGFDPEPFLKINPVPAGEKTEKNSFVIGAVGRLTEVKGYRYIIEAVALLKKPCPGLSATIIGEGPEGGRLRELARRLGVADRVKFAAGQPAEHLASFQALAAPHLEPEGRPVDGPYWPGRAAAEAQVAGRPVLTTLRELAPGQFEVGDACLFAAAGEATGLARGIEYLYRHLEEAAALAERGRRTALEHFSLEAMVEKTLAVYRELTA